MPACDGNKIIAHVCNDNGGWGAGFTGAVSACWDEPEFAYRTLHRRYGITLGTAQLVMVGPDLWVANMFAQRGYSGPGCPAIRYRALAQALEEVAQQAILRFASIHMPRIGCGLAGGDWETVGPIVERELCDRGIDVTVYDLPTVYDPA